jgi:hypothetical protein
MNIALQCVISGEPQALIFTSGGDSISYPLHQGKQRPVSAEAALNDCGLYQELAFGEPAVMEHVDGNV